MDEETRLIEARLLIKRLGIQLHQAVHKDRGVNGWLNCPLQPCFDAKEWLKV